MVTISLKPGNDTYAGTATADSINGLAGNDTLLGGAGNDSIDGGVGNDGLWGGIGADTLWGGEGSDYLYGGSGNDVLNGGAGRDGLNGGLGDDSYQVDDSVDEILDSGGDDTVISTIDYTLPVELEQLILKGIAFNGVGNGLDNRLTGNEAANRLYGDAGNDTLLGMGGDDLLEGGRGEDTIRYLGTWGDYEIIQDRDNESWTIKDLRGTKGDGVDEGTDRLMDIESVLFADNETLLFGETVVSISEAEVLEGNRGSSLAKMTVSLQNPTLQTVTVDYATQDGTAQAGSDYKATQGRLTFKPGETRKMIQIPVTGDTGSELDELVNVQLTNPVNATLGHSAATLRIINDETAKKGQAVIDLGSQYGKLINPVTVDGGRVYYYWDVSGDGTSSDTKGAGYANSRDYVSHDWLDTLFQQDVNGRVEGENGAPVVYQDGNTDNTYRYATLNGVKLALPTVGNGDDFIGSGEYGYRNGTAVQGTANNPTYDDYLAIWDAYNGTGTGTVMNGTPPGWVDDNFYWSATPAASGHAYLYLSTGGVNVTYDSLGTYVAVEVL